MVIGTPGFKRLKSTFGLAALIAPTGRPYMSARVCALSPGPRTYTFSGSAAGAAGAAVRAASPAPLATVFAWSCSSSTRFNSMARCCVGQIRVSAYAVLFGQRRHVNRIDRLDRIRRAGLLRCRHGVLIDRVVEHAIFLVALRAPEQA